MIQNKKIIKIFGYASVQPIQQSYREETKFILDFCGNLMKVN